MTEPQTKIPLPKLIAELCPDGVEFKTLKEICEITRGARVTKKDLLQNGKYPVVSGGIGFMGYLDDYNREAETITIAQYGTAGYVKWQQQKFWANDVCFSVIPDEKIILNKYLYYFLANNQEYLYSISNREAIPYSIDREKILKIKAPIPPIEVQREIVRILDKFIELIALLEKERIMRKKQYEYYGNKLFTFNDDVPRVPLADYCDIISGFPFDSSKFSDSGIRLMRGMNVKRGEFNFSEPLCRYWKDDAGLEKFLLKENDIIIAMDGALIGKSYGYVYERHLPMLLVQRVARIRTEKQNSRYIYHYLASGAFAKMVDKKKTEGAIPHITLRDIANFEIPLPPLSEQKRIAGILDRFDALCNDLSSGIPAEIAAREKQYEYYRDRLLTFKEKNLTDGG